MWALRDRHTLEWLAAEWDGSQPRFTRALAGAAHFASASDARYTANALARDGRAVEVRMVFVEARAA